ncbi:hypothetical protein niasHS_009669 [Heterodera schachtii]|uniref:Uncharacterized protein n=1 Tax=Heterodera schachtii TaxID=97005 RepID=A0ABD2J718_HETSC
MHPNDQRRRDQNEERRLMKKELAEIIQPNIELDEQILKRKKETAQIEERRKRIESDLAFKAFQIEHQAKQLKEETSQKEEAQEEAIKEQQLKEEALLEKEKTIEDKQFYRKRALQYLGEVEETETKKSVLNKALAFVLGSGNAKRKKANAGGSGPSYSISCPIELSAHSAVFEKHAFPKEDTIVEEVGLEDEQKNNVGKMVAHEMSLADELKMADQSADNNDETITGTRWSKASVAPNLALEHELQMVDENVLKKGNMICSSKSSASQKFVFAQSVEESKCDDGDTDLIGNSFAGAHFRPLLIVGLSIVVLLLLTFLIIIVSIRFNLI